MEAQNELLEIEGHSERRYELLSAIGHARELRRTLAHYTKDAERRLNAGLDQAHKLAVKATLVGQVGMNDHLGEMKAFAHESEILAAATSIYLPVNDWSEKLHAICEAPELKAQFRRSLGMTLNHASALEALELLIARLPPLPTT